MNHKHTSLTRGSAAALWAWAFLAFFFTVRPAVADSNATVHTKFRVISWDNNISGISFDTGGKAMPLEANGAYRSLWYEYSGPAMLKLYRPGPKGADGKPNNTIVATIDLSKAPAVPLIMLVNDASNPGTYTYTILDDNYNDFPYGSASFYNFTEENDVVGLDASAHTIRPGEHFVDKTKPGKDGQGFSVATVLREGVQDGAELLHDSWPYRPDYRRLVLIGSVKDPAGTPHFIVKWFDEQNLPPMMAQAPSSSSSSGSSTSRQGQGQQQGGQQNRNNNAGG